MTNGNSPETSLWLPPNYQPPVSVGEKAADLDALGHSVLSEAIPTSPQPSVSTMLLFNLAQAGDAFTPWGSDPITRDRQLRAFWHTEPFLSGGIGIITARNAAMSWKVVGPPASADAGANLLQNANFGSGGWEDFVAKITIDLLTQDKGAFAELVRAADSPDAPVVGLNSLDAARCHPTGVPEEPVIYEDADGRFHKLKWYQVVQLLEIPSPVTFSRLGHFYRLQYSAITRLLRAAQIIKSIGVYNEEKITGRFMRGIHLLSGVTAPEVADALRRAELLADNAGQSRYMQPAMVGSIDPKAEVKATTLDLAKMPEGWDEENSLKWYITAMSMALLTDYQEFAPLPGGNLGTSAQSEILHRKSRGKGQGLFQQLIARLINLHGVLPQNVEFQWDEVDVESEKQEAEVKQIRAEEREIRLGSGELLPQEARQLALDSGDLPEELFAAIDLTPDEPVEGEDRTGQGAPRTGDDTMVQGADRTDGDETQLGERGMTVVTPSYATKARTAVPFGTLITSRLHRVYSTTADDASGLGYFPELDDRLAVANSIGPALKVFEELLRKAEVWDIPVEPEDADRLVEAGLKQLDEDEERAGPEEARLEFESDVAGTVLRGLARVRRDLRQRLEALAE